MESESPFQAAQRRLKEKAAAEQPRRRGGAPCPPYTHGEAFCLMFYRCETGRHHELLWNSRDGVTPFLLGCRVEGCGKLMQHVAWDADLCVPDFKPPAGMRIFRDGRPEEAVAIMRRRVEQLAPTYGIPDGETAESYAQRLARDPDGEFKPGWPTVEEVRPTPPTPGPRPATLDVTP